MTLKILLFSGGVDSTLVLNKLIAEGIIPTIFHFWPAWYNKTHERKVRKLARMISPKSEYYVFQVHDFDATLEYKHPYYGIPIDNGCIYPLLYGDEVIIGYSKWIYHTYADHRPHKGFAQQDFINLVKVYNLPFTFPLADLRRTQLDEMFSQLPQEQKDLVVSDTRNYNFGGTYVKADPA